MTIARKLTRCVAKATGCFLLGLGPWGLADSSHATGADPTTRSMSDRESGDASPGVSLPKVSDASVFGWLIRSEAAPRGAVMPAVARAGGEIDEDRLSDPRQASNRAATSPVRPLRRVAENGGNTETTVSFHDLLTWAAESPESEVPEIVPRSAEEFRHEPMFAREEGSPKPLRSQRDLFENLWGRPLGSPADDETPMDTPSPNFFPFTSPLLAHLPMGSRTRFVPDEEWGERGISPSVYTWSAPHFFHHPLYFEQVNLERYGQGPHRCLQPLYSAAHFFGTVPLMPYKAGSSPPHERVHVLGHRRPGSFAPYQWHWTRFSWRGVAYQGLATAGVAVALP